MTNNISLCVINTVAILQWLKGIWISCWLQFSQSLSDHFDLPSASSTNLQHFHNQCVPVPALLFNILSLYDNQVGFSHLDVMSSPNLWL